MRKRASACRALLCLGFLISIRAFPSPAISSRVDVVLDSSEAEQVLAILAVHQAGKPVEEAQWQALFATEPYQRLKEREKKIGEQFQIPTLAFSDDDFKKFVLSENLGKQTAQLRKTVESWKKADIRILAERDLEYLPPSAMIRAKVYPTIKPRDNSFVWEANSNPAIFLYVDPDVSSAKFENTVAHELHHIGLASVASGYDAKLSLLPEQTRAAAEWMGGFGEGLAMLAAAGGPGVDPHAASSAQEREQWNHDLANFDTDLQSVNTFLLDAVDGKYSSRDAIDEKARSFYGKQGPWYTVGYKMSVIVEKRFGRPALIDAMLDPRKLLVLYNRAAAEQNALSNQQLPLWSPEVLKRVEALP